MEDVTRVHVDVSTRVVCVLCRVCVYVHVYACVACMYRPGLRFSVAEIWQEDESSEDAHQKPADVRKVVHCRDGVSERIQSTKRERKENKI